MWHLSLAILDIALHRRSPADLPASQAVLGLVLAADAVIALTALRLETPLSRAAAMLLFDVALYFGTIYAALTLFDRPRRFLQTATAAVGADVLMNAIALPVLLWHVSLDAPIDEMTTPLFLILLLLVWNVDIGGYILSRALDRPYVVGVSIMLVYVLTSMALRNALFPAS